MFHIFCNAPEKKKKKKGEWNGTVSWEEQIHTCVVSVRSTFSLSSALPSKARGTPPCRLNFISTRKRVNLSWIKLQVPKIFNFLLFLLKFKLFLSPNVRNETWCWPSSFVPPPLPPTSSSTTGVFNLLSSRANLRLSYNPAGPQSLKITK